MDIERFTPLQSSEAAPLRALIPKFERICASPPSVTGILERNGSEEPTRAWRIKLRPNNPKRVTDKAVLTDWDDTLEPYSQRKTTLYQSYRDLFSEQDAVTQGKIMEFCKAINKAARVLPVSSTHPERYSPFLEVYSTSRLFDLLHIDLQKNQTLIEDTSETAVRLFIQTHILPELSQYMETKTEDTKDGKSKQYFREKSNQSLAINFEKKPHGVNEEVWGRFKKAMTEANIPPEELSNFDLNDATYWAISSFGEINFQLEKMLNTLDEFKQKGIQIPDEIILFTRGRKEPILKKVTSEWVTKGMSVVYIDDSVSQLKRVLSFTEEFGDKFTALRAQRAFSKRSGDSTPPEIKEVYMGSQTLSHIVDSAFKPRGGPLPSEYS